MNALVTPDTVAEFTLAAYCIPAVESKLATMNRRAKRLGLAELQLVTVRRWERDTGRRYVGGEPIMIEMVDFEVRGEKPTVPGFELLGRIDHNDRTDGSANMLLGDVPESYRTARPHCDHCNTVRRRKSTVVFRDADGNTVQVGTNCLQDYFARPMSSVLAWCGFVDTIGSWDEDGFGGGGGDYRDGIDLLSYLAAAQCAVRTWGWERTDGDAPTRDAAWEILNPRPRGKNEPKLPEITREHVEFARAALAWIRDLPANERSSGYLANLYASCVHGYVPKRGDGLCASLVGAAYPNAINREIERKQRAAVPESKHVGEVGDKIVDLPVEVLRVRYSRGWEDSVLSIISMRDDNGNDLTWFAGGDFEFETGARRFLSGSVKRLGEFKGRAQTIMTRCTLTRTARCTVGGGRGAWTVLGPNGEILETIKRKADAVKVAKEYTIAHETAAWHA